MPEPTAKVIHYTEVPAVEFGPTGPGAAVRWLIDDDHDGAPIYAMRMIEIQPGGNSPRHMHPYEHENFVVEGKARLFIDGIWHELNPGDVAFVPPGVLHQYVNAGETVLKFLCSIPVKNLQGMAIKPAGQPAGGEALPQPKKASC
jgi:quercetin dioxygenase-like cupin family protein